jgi:hypothetical protein
MLSVSGDLLDYFLGHWQFVRSMRGFDGVSIGVADGRAEFQRQADGRGLHYRESGKLQLASDARPISFSRRFDYHWQDGLIHVSFADGPQAGQAYQHYRYDPLRQALLPEATHVCLKDHYDGDYRLLDQHHFDLQTRIDGPHKDYLLLTHFVRCVQT